MESCSALTSQNVSLYVTVEVVECPLKISMPKCPGPRNVTSEGKEDFANMIKLRILNWGDCPGLSKDPKI